ncbi:hypothetical protein ROZALSC1DRAFT_26845 [Rozella allomycis CSF55]|uniref:Uncharacterized protein n=1 Tax=Rozella allomycis (strain CSF55) TaxID=988480 RepID=A0A075AZ97_ROZAC|nr:hypothetical protein O9G_003757 [Rozella allomycis CSF55]RKP21764.1 hypothetical protein ROZALSC1DRAFT_26843 [Rozella allomycis CSF55]RKP21767.1 hypothetical protein ROZALSC1DRAFT_26845 [Rozella allomycis CSF55]|eukprot:EPZ34037.1 hypothetical protein O9G_003757 [Rozella allomycis CSF55]
MKVEHKSQYKDFECKMQIEKWPDEQWLEIQRRCLGIANAEMPFLRVAHSIFLHPYHRVVIS